MRFSGLLPALLLAALALPASAQTQAPPGPHNFGGITCPQKVPCPDSHEFSYSDPYVSVANACVTQFFGYTSEAGFFDTGRGLDSNYCLSTIPNILPKISLTRTQPVCCLTEAQDQTCNYHCDLVSVPE